MRQLTAALVLLVPASCFATTWRQDADAAKSNAFTQQTSASVQKNATVVKEVVTATNYGEAIDRYRAKFWPNTYQGQLDKHNCAVALNMAWVDIQNCLDRIATGNNYMLEAAPYIPAGDNLYAEGVASGDDNSSYFSAAFTSYNSAGTRYGWAYYAYLTGYQDCDDAQVAIDYAHFLMDHNN